MRLVGADRGAEIEHDTFALDCRPQRRKRRPLDALDHLQIKARHRHQRAGIAGRHRDVGLALLHRIERKPHRRFPAPIAQRLARLVVHANGDVGVHDLGFGLERGQALERWLDQRAVAIEQKLGVGMPGERNERAGQNDRRPVVAAHGVKRDANFIRHAVRLYPLGCGRQTGIGAGAWLAHRSCLFASGAFSSRLRARRRDARRRRCPEEPRILRRPCADRDRCRE